MLYEHFQLNHLEVDDLPDISLNKDPSEGSNNNSSLKISPNIDYETDGSQHQISLDLGRSVNTSCNWSFQVTEVGENESFQSPSPKRVQSTHPKRWDVNENTWLTSTPLSKHKSPNGNRLKLILSSKRTF